MNEFIRRPSRRRGRGNDTPTQLVKKTLVKRSWTISSPSGVGREVDNKFSPKLSPRKPPRRSTPTDENKPPWEYQLPEKPPRRYSMSSYDGLSTKGRCSRDSTSVSSSPIPNGNSSQYNQRRTQPEYPRYYFFGSESQIENQRPSTLPRKPHHKSTASSLENFADPARFHSIPRNRPRSESSQRGKSEPPRINPALGPLRENYPVRRYVSSGPVTSTPIISASNHRGSSPRYTSHHSQQEPRVPTAHRSSFPKHLSQSSLVDVKDTRRRTSNELSPDIRVGDSRREDEGGGGHWVENRRGSTIQNSSSPPLFDSGRSGSSRCLTSETSDEAEERTKRTSSNKILPRSNTSISSGAATTGRQKNKPNHASTSVRRCRSFQAETSRPVVENRQAMTRGQVARYVQELEKGIQLTVANMTPKKGSTLNVNDSFNSSLTNLDEFSAFSRDTSHSRSPPEVRKQFTNEGKMYECENNDKQHSQNSDNSSGDIGLDANKITPGENDYKIVFISSDSSKESELNSSIDSDNPATPPRKRSAELSETETTEFGESDSEEKKRLVKCRKNLKEKLGIRKLVDAAVMTEDFNSDEGSDEDMTDDASLSLSLRVPSPVESKNQRKDFSQPFREAHSSNPVEKAKLAKYTHPLDSLGPQELKAMLQQTETVQAEAQALKRALMGAFEPQPQHKRELLLAPNLTLPQNSRKSHNCHIGHNQGGSRVQGTRFDIPQKAAVNAATFPHRIERNGHALLSQSPCEDIEIAGQNHKTVFTQTDPEQFSGDDSDISDTGGDSDISCDSLQDGENTPPPDLISFGDLPDKNAKLHPSPSNMGSVRKETNQDVPAPPFYLASPPPPFPCRIQTPSTHPRLTLNEPQHSVLLSSDSESVHRLPRFGGQKSVHVAEVNISDTHANKVPKYSDCANQSVCAPKPLESDLFKGQNPHQKNGKSNGGGSCFLASPPLHLTNNKPSTFRTTQYASSGLFVPKKEPQNFSSFNAMNSPQGERKSQFSGQEEGDINASKKVICQGGEAISFPSLEAGGLEGTSSSSASEEDTDEDVHISRSYDVSVDLNTSKGSDAGDVAGEGVSFPHYFTEASKEENTAEDSSTSESETDDEKHTTGEYAVTKVSSSESERENDACNLAETQENNSDLEFSQTREEENDETEKADLPECDQALSESAPIDNDISEQEIVSTNVPVNNCDISDISNTHSVNPEQLPPADEDSFVSPELDSQSDIPDEALECAAENKSETESNIGLDMDIQELSSSDFRDSKEILDESNNEIKKGNENTTKEFTIDDDLSSGESDKEFVRLEKEFLSESSAERENHHQSPQNKVPCVSDSGENDQISPKVAKTVENELAGDKIVTEDLEQDKNVCQTTISSEALHDAQPAENSSVDKQIDDNPANVDVIPNEDMNSTNGSNLKDNQHSCLSNDARDLESIATEISQTNETPLESSSINKKVTEMAETEEIFTKSEEKSAVEVPSNQRHSAAATGITRSTEVEQENSSCIEQSVTLDNLLQPVVGSPSCENRRAEVHDDKNLDITCTSSDVEVNKEIVKQGSSESGHSNNSESEKEDSENTVKINVNEQEADRDETHSNQIHPPKGVDGTTSIEHKTTTQSQDLPNITICSPPVPIRRAKRSSSSDGLSSPSDIERSDADASDSADTIIDGTRFLSLRKRVNFSDVEEDPNKETDRPSSSSSVLQSADNEYQCLDGSEEGNLISIVAVGEENPRKNSQGKIYIRSDSTDSDVQIKPTCIVVTGSSGIESGEDCENEQSKNIKDKEGNDVTILEVTSDHRKDHVMSVRVTSPESSRRTSPTRNRVSELQSMILTTRESQQQARCSPIEVRESSSLANYFTVTLGTNSPLTPRRVNKTPEVRRRKLKERGELNESSTIATTPTPTLTPSPSHTPSPTLTPTPDHSEGDLLAYEETHDAVQETFEREEFSHENSFEFYDETSDNYELSDMHEIHMDQDDIDITFDSIEDTEESLGESNYSETSSEDGFEREDEIRGYAKRAYSFTLHTIIEESCEESDYEKRNQEEEALKRDPSQLEKYFYFDLGNGPADSKKFANEESEYSDTFSETSSSAFSEGMESTDQNSEEEIDPAELASSRLEKYFSGFLNFERQPSIRSIGEESEIHTDESDSVGSDSEGSASPEQPRGKKFVKTRGVRSFSSNRSHGYSSDKGEGMISDGSHNSGEGEENDKTLVSGEDEISTESEEIGFEKSDGQFDTIKRRKKKKIIAETVDKKIESEKSDIKYQACEKEQESNQKFFQESETSKLSKEEANAAGDNLIDVRKNEITEKTTQTKEKTPVNDSTSQKSIARDGSGMNNDLAVRKYQSRDSGFIGSSDDLLKDKPEETFPKEADSKEHNRSDSSTEEIDSKKTPNTEDSLEKSHLKETVEPKTSDESTGTGKSESDKSSNDGKVSRSSTGSSVDLPAYSSTKGSQNLSRKDSFNNWSSDEETNLMMNRMRLFFRNMFSYSSRDAQKGQRVKFQLEARLTDLMKTVPGINDEQVKEMVGYLSSEETRSDSNDSSDYTSSDLECAYARLEHSTPESKTELQEQISASCQQIIKNFDPSKDAIDMASAHPFIGGRAFSESSGSTSPASKDTVFVYQKVFSSLANLKPDSDRGSIGSGSQGTSPPLLAKVMHHIGNSLVALMHEVSAGSENGDDIDSFNGGQLATSSPRQTLFLPKKHKASDSISFDSSLDKSSLNSNSFESEESPTDTEQSPESEIGTPKAIRQQRYSLMSEKSSGEDFTSIESQRTVFGSHEYSRQHFRQEPAKASRHKSSSQRSLEERNVTFPQYFSYELRNDTEMKEIDDDKFDVREHIGASRLARSNRIVETRKAKSQLNLEKIHHDEGKNTGERSESLGDLLDRVKSSDYSSSYEQLDSDSTLKASDSLDRHISSSSSNVRLNASSRGSLTTSSRGSLAASSRGSLNASSRGSLQGSSGPEEDEEKKMKKPSFLRYTRRSSVPESTKETPKELKSITLPRSNPTQMLATGTMPRSQPSQSQSTPSSSTGLFATLPSLSSSERQAGSAIAGPPRSARYHAPGYRPPPSSFLPKRTISTPALRKDKLWHSTDESVASIDDGVGASFSASSASFGSLHKATPQRGTARGSAITSANSSRAASPFGESWRGSLGKTSSTNASATGSLASFENYSPEEEDARKPHLQDAPEGRRNSSSLSALGPKSRSESLASVCSTGAEGRYGAVQVMGELRVGLQYNYKESFLECNVLQCRDLSPVDAKRNRSDPYVKAYLLPDKSKNGKRKTKVKRHTLNPVFEETLKFNTPLSDLESRTLWLSVWHSDMFGRNDFLGEVMIPLSDALFDESAPRWYSLQDRMEPLEDTKYGAVIIIALKFVPPDVLATTGTGGSSKRSKKSRGALQVRVKEANGLVGVRPQSPPDPVCKGVLLPEKGKASKQKTSVCRKTSTPKWNHTMTFDDVTRQELLQRSLEISVWDHDRFGGSDFLGGCRFNMGKDTQNESSSEWMDSSGLELKLWSQMLEKPNLWVESSILLRSAMDRPIYSSSFTE